MMINITYGQSDFKALIEKGFFYQDRTEFVEILEKWKSNFPVFLRPRRFGKSLFIMMLQHYYGLEYKDEFPTLFKDLYIGQHPTPEANTYMVLSFDFSGIDTGTHDSTYKGFLSNAINGVRIFMSAYSSVFTTKSRSCDTNTFQYSTNKECRT
jgi:hypothetical protein